MRERRLARWCRRELQAMEIAAPLRLDELGAAIARRRGRPLEIEPYPLQVGLFGLWLASPDGDVILYQAETTPEHQKDIVLHEFGHMLAEHQSDEVDVTALRCILPNLPDGVIHAALRRTCYNDAREREAELAATIIAEWAERVEYLTPSRSRGATHWLDTTFNEPVGWT